MPLLRVPVESSQLKSVGYDPATQVLEVEFKSYSKDPKKKPPVYQYFGVPPELHTDLMNADSHGAFFNANVKKAAFEYKRMPDEEDAAEGEKS